MSSGAAPEMKYDFSAHCGTAAGWPNAGAGGPFHVFLTGPFP